MRMLKKSIIFLLLLPALCFALNLSAFTVASPNMYDVNDQYGNAITIEVDIQESEGIARLAVSGTTRQASVIVSSEKGKYTYKTASDVPLTIPLNMGSRTYTFSVYLHVYDTWFEEIWTRDYSIDVENSLAPFLSSSQMVNWSPGMSFVNTAKELTANKASKDAALSICSYISNHFTYVSPSDLTWYVPDLEKVYAQKSGTCYDFAALFAGMCRSAGIPCRMEFGYSQYVEAWKYHAWCSVYIDGAWHIVDPTYSLEYGSAFLDPAKISVELVY